MKPKFSTRMEAKKAGWFSRRHQTSEHHAKIVESKREKQQHRNLHAAELRAARDNRTAKEQVALLDQRLGVGVGAKKERARLSKFIFVR